MTCVRPSRVRRPTSRHSNENELRTQRDADAAAEIRLPARRFTPLAFGRSGLPVCRHRAVIDHARLMNGRPKHIRLVDLEGRLLCQRCGHRGGHTLTVRMRR